MKRSILLFCGLVLVLCCTTAFTQKKKPRYGAICGDPTVKCKFAEGYQSYDLPFDMGKNYTIAESVQFYGIVLKSVKLKDFGDCGNPSFKEQERVEIQALFEHNKVFMQNCVESASIYYTGVPDYSAFIAVYAGKTLAEANKFLKTVQDTGKFPGIRVRKMRAEMNGT
ncbi:MAG TPA: hypothetical protein VL501_02310 [Pyrinomonadaceae bacterium]|nr:hypothetical protein [Pyrinomonadaceae bacterium]